MEPGAIHNDSDIKPCPQCGNGVRFRVDAESRRRSCPHCGYVLPHQIKHFQLSEIIGAGGMGAVYRGLDTSLERQVAVKVMREEFARNPQFVENFLREAQATAKLNHPNVAQLYSFGEENSRYYLVMEFLPGGSLDDRIEKGHRLNELEVLDVGIQIAGGLKAAYQQGLIHRDIKPGNILFAQDGTAKVVDFGLARYENATGQSHQEEGIWGTPYYIAPEKVSDNKEDFRSDIYSLGGTLFHALAGRAPFEAATSTDVVMKHLHAAAVSLKAFAPDCTLQTVEVIGRMLKREPAERPQSYEDLLNDLAYAKRFALEKKPVALVEEKDELPTRLLVGTSLIFLMCIAAGVWLWFNRSLLFGEPTRPAPRPPTPVAGNKTNTAIQTGVPVDPGKQPVKPADPSASPQPDYAADIGNAYDLVSRGPGELEQAIRVLETLQKQLPLNHALHPWVNLHLGRLHLLAGHDAQAMGRLQTVAGAFTPASAVTEEQYPSLLALVLLGKLTTETRDSLLPSLPFWMQAIARFDAGLVILKQGQLEETAKLWRDYSQIAEERVEKKQRWTLSLQPFARDFADEEELFRQVDQKVRDLQAQEKFQEIQPLLQEHQNKWQHPTIRTRIAKLADLNRQVVVDTKKKRDENAEEERKKFEANENKLIDGERIRKKTFMAVYQFDQMLAGWKALAPLVKTDKSGKIVSYEIEVAQCLADYKAGILRDVVAFPYDQERLVAKNNRKMIGKLIRIQNDLFLFEKDLGGGQSAKTKCTWAELHPLSVMELGDFYLLRKKTEPEPNNIEIARRAIALAVFSREYTLPDTYLRKYQSLVNQTGADVRETIKKLFPTAVP